MSSFYSTFTMIVPQGSGVALLRSVEYFGGNGSRTPIVTLMLWGALGCLLALVATVVRVVAAHGRFPKFGHRAPRPAPLNYRASHDHIAGRDRPVLRPRLLSPAD